MQPPLESNYAESGTPNGPTAHLIEENIVLPKDMFNSYGSYLLNEVLHSKSIMFFVLIIVGLIFINCFFLMVTSYS